MEDHVELVKDALLFAGETHEYRRPLYKDVSLVVKKGTPLLLLGASEFPAAPAISAVQALTKRRFNLAGVRALDGSPVDITLTGTYISMYIIGEIIIESIDGQPLDSQHIERIVGLIKKREAIAEHDEVVIIIEDNETGFYYRAPKPPTAEKFITESRNNKRVHRAARQIVGVISVALRSIMSGDKTTCNSIARAVTIGDMPDDLWQLAVIEAQEQLIEAGYAPLQSKPLEGKPGEYLITLPLPTSGRPS